MSAPAAEPAETRVTALELFFDLVFVFAITQVTESIAHHPTWETLMHGLFMLGAIWWAWGCYAWVMNSASLHGGLIDEGAPRVTIFAAMACMLIVAMALPEAFGANGTVFAVGLFVVRVLHLVLYWLLSKDDRQMRTAVLGLIPSMTVAPIVLIVSASFDGVAQDLLWAAALLIDFVGLLLGGVRGWRVNPSHFVERYGAIVIIALGESVVSIGVGATGLEMDAGLIITALLGMAVAGALWWSYFDVVAIVAERKLRQASPERQARVARDNYTYFHFLLIAGIVLFALGVKETIAHYDEPLEDVPAVALCGGIALYYLGHVLMRLRNVGTVNKQRVVTIIVALALIPLALHADALIALGAISALCVALTLFETIHHAEARDRIRHAEASMGS